MIKRIIYESLASICIIITILLSALYSEFIPEHWGKLTITTAIIIYIIYNKLMPDKYI